MLAINLVINKRAKEEVRKLQEEAHKQVEEAHKQVEKKNQEIKQMIQLMFTNGMSLEFISKSLSKSEDEIRDLLG